MDQLVVDHNLDQVVVGHKIDVVVVVDHRLDVEQDYYYQVEDHKLVEVMDHKLVVVACHILVLDRILQMEVGFHNLVEVHKLHNLHNLQVGKLGFHRLVEAIAGFGSDSVELELEEQNLRSAIWKIQKSSYCYYKVKAFL